MTIEQWNKLSNGAKEKLISEVFNSVYLAATHFAQNPMEDAIIQEVLRVTVIVGEKAHIDIHKEIQII